jgi:hypothetical protein
MTSAGRWRNLKEHHLQKAGYERTVIMRIKSNYVAAMVAAGAAALAIAAAPTASAATVQHCVNSGVSASCQTAGNVQIVTAPTDQRPRPYTDDLKNSPG